MNASCINAELSREDRLRSVQATGLLDAPADPQLNRVAALAARLMKTEVALLSLVTADRQYFAAHTGLQEPFSETQQTPISHSFCKYVVSSQKPFVVTDARIDPLLQDNGAVSDLSVISYLGVPVRDREGRVLGSLCAIGSAPRDWSDEDVGIMTDLAAIAEDEVVLRSQAVRAKALAVENGLLAREYHHRVKNTLAVSAALVKLSGKDAKSVDELVEGSVSRLSALGKAHDAFISGNDAVDLQQVVERLLAPYCHKGCAASTGGGPLQLRHEQVTPICLFLHELATNSAKYGALSRGEPVSVLWDVDGGEVALQWVETMLGPAEPDTPGSATGGGFGSKLLQASARQLGGTCISERTDDALRVQLTFPLR